MQKDIVFLIFAVLCIWLVMDQLVGKKYIGSFITNLIASFQQG